MKKLSELTKKNALYIHGLGSNKNSSTSQTIKENFPEYRWITETFDLTSPGVLDKINHIIHTNKIKLVVASSLGAFYATLIEESVARILINPCLKPSVEIPKLEKLSDKQIKMFEELEKQSTSIIDNEIRGCTFGVFGTEDELFSYKDEFAKRYGKSRLITVSGKHRLDKNTIVDSIKTGLDYFNSLDKVRLNESQELIMEHFVNLFVDKDGDKIEKYKDEVWDILVASYKSIGGIFGVDNIQDLINDTDFWKLCTKANKVVACALYSWKRGGRKLICGGTNQTSEGKEWFYKILEEDIKFSHREAWAEVSDKLEHVMIKKLGAIPVPSNVAKKILKDKVFISYNKDGYHYTRSIAGHEHEKIMVANPEGFPKQFQVDETE